MFQSIGGIKSDILSYSELRSLITTTTTRRENAWHKKRYTSRTRGIMTTTPAWLVGSSLILPQSRTDVSSSSSYHHLTATASEGYYCKSGKKLPNSPPIQTRGRVYCNSIAASSQNIKPKDADELQFHPTIFNADRQDETDVLIECKNVYKSFGAKHILRGVNLKIKHGEAVGIIGPSGTGKSTILKIISGLLAPDKGEVYIRGRRRHGLISDDDMSGLRIGLVFQSAALFDSLTVRENVGFLLYEKSRMPDDQIQQLVTETLAAVGLKDVEDRMPSELSGGMKKRVALARSIIYDTTNNAIEPEVLLYDEPTAGLDPIASTVVEDLIRSVHCKGQDAVGKPGKIASYVVVTHQHSTIKRAVDRLVFLHEGKVVWEGMTDEFTSSTNPIVEQFASGNLDGPIQY